MIKRACYKIFEEEQIIIEYFSGRTIWSDLIKMKKREVAEANYNSNFNIITDVRNAILDVEDLNNVNKYLEYLRNNNKSVGNRKTAILTNSSEQIIHSELLRAMKADLPINFKSVGTTEAAFKWTELNHNTILKISECLEDLEKDLSHISSN